MVQGHSRAGDRLLARRALRRSNHHRRLIFAKGAAQHLADLADGDPALNAGDQARQDVLVAAGRPFQRAQQGAHLLGIAPGAPSRQPRALLGFDCRVHLELCDAGVGSVVRDKRIDADDQALLGFHLALVAIGGLGDLGLHPATFDCFHRAAHCVNLFNQRAGALLDFVGEVFDGVGPAERIYSIGDAALVSDDLLRAQRSAGGLGGGQLERLVPAVGV